MRMWGSPTINLTQEAVQEFKVFRYQFDAQYGKALGAVVSVVTKSGANEVRGSGFYFGRDDSLNAPNAFAATKPPFDEQRWGLSLGGPLVRNRTHVFGAYESDHQDTARIVALSASNPFASRENGIFPARSDERMAVIKIDHRFADAHSALVRYVYDNQDGERSLLNPHSDSSQIDMFNRAHSLVGEENWAVSSRVANTLRVHWFQQTSGGVPHHANRRPAEVRPSVGTGLTSWWRLADVSAKPAGAVRYGLHDRGCARPESRRRVRSRVARAGRAFLRGRVVSVSQRCAVQCGRPRDLADTVPVAAPKRPAL